MEITGKIITVLPLRSGMSARGTEWRSQTAVLETQEQYPKKVAFDVMGERIDDFNLQIGEYVTVSFDFDAHEYNGRWFNSVRAWKVERPNATQTIQPAPQQSVFANPPAQQQAPVQQQPPQQPQVQQQPQAQQEDNLPF